MHDRRSFLKLAHVTGVLRSDGTHLHGDWYIEILDPNGKTLVVFGNATSGTRLG